MTVVADANLLAALVIPTDYSAAAEERFGSWIDDGVEVCSLLQDSLVDQPDFDRTPA